jgi:signal transduction histidine kinase
MHLEEILQKDINEDVFQRVVMVMNSLKRLTALNQNLLLLAKIENMQFEAGSDIILNEVFLRKIKEFTPVFDEKKLELDVQSEGNFVIRMNEYLSEILLATFCQMP